MVLNVFYFERCASEPCTCEKKTNRKENEREREKPRKKTKHGLLGVKSEEKETVE